MWSLLLTVVASSRVTAVEDSAIQRAIEQLIHHNDTEDTNVTAGPDEQFVRSVAEGLELYIIKKTMLGRQGAQGTPFDEASYRAALGPRNVTQIPDEAQESLRAVTLEGDMILNPDQIRSMLTGSSEGEVGTSQRRRREAQTSRDLMWNPNNPIPYQIDSSLSGLASLIYEALQFWTDHTCLSFRADSTAFNRLRIYRGSGCWSYIGKQPAWASQDVSIGYGCESLGTVTHEIAHALGFYHTQSRYDRDSYINVNYANIQSDMQYNFEKQTSATEQHFGLSYDYGSVMQYSPYAFAINTNIPTTTAKSVNYQNMMGQRESPSFADVKQMNLYYNCAARCSRRPTCMNNGIPNSRTCTICICPRSFGGYDCSQLNRGTASVCNGQVIRASSTSYTSFSANVGKGTGYSYSSTPVVCYWHIQAPTGRRLQFQIKSLNTNCMEGCDWAGFEVNVGNLDLSGMLICCSSISNQHFSSVGSIVTIRGLTRYKNANMVINYRVI